MVCYCCIDLKSFFASVEAVDRGLDPFTTNLVVADSSRGKGSICLAITPAMKALGIKNRCRIFEIPEHIEYISAIGYSKDVWRPTGGSRKLDKYTSSYKKIVAEFEKLYRETTVKNYPIRKINVGLNNVVDEDGVGF